MGFDSELYDSGETQIKVSNEGCLSYDYEAVILVTLGSVRNLHT